MEKATKTKILVTISAVAIAWGVAIGAYYGYEYYERYKAEQLNALLETPSYEEASSANANTVNMPSTNPSAPLQAGTQASTDTNTDAGTEEVSNIHAQENEPDINLDKIANSIKQQSPITSHAQDSNPKASQKLNNAKAKVSTKPKLAIIMDDMAYPTQVASLKKLNLPITPSFFPTSPDSPDTAKLARNMPFYMVHLPLESLDPNVQKTRQKWLFVGTSSQEITGYIHEIQQQFPRLIFLNNHTGSKFSASEADMTNLLHALWGAGIEFVDSRTTTETTAPKLHKQAQRALLQRDVFLDNITSVAHTTSQLKLAIHLAKKKGYAIAICHPHKSTFKALEQAKKTLFRDVELVYINDLPIAQKILAARESNMRLAQANKQKASTPPISNPSQSEAPQAKSTLHASLPPSSSTIPSISSNPPRNALFDDATDSLEDFAPSTPTDISSASSLLQSLTPPQDTSKIDTSVFKEVKRIQESTSQNIASLSPSNKAQKPSKATQTSKKPTQKASTTKATASLHAKATNATKASTNSFRPQPKVCAKNEFEAFVSGCDSSEPQGFINMKWSSDAKKKPKDLLPDL